jgi:hypothetical protein
MKQSIMVGMFVAILWLGFVSTLRAQAAVTQSEAAAPKWEYQVVSITTSNTRINQDKLNELGKHGWELVSVQTWAGGNSGLFYFKRPLVQ